MTDFRRNFVGAIVEDIDHGSGFKAALNEVIREGTKPTTPGDPIIRQLYTDFPTDRKARVESVSIGERADEIRNAVDIVRDSLDDMCETLGLPKRQGRPEAMRIMLAALEMGALDELNAPPEEIL